MSAGAPFDQTSVKLFSQRVPPNDSDRRSKARKSSIGEVFVLARYNEIQGITVRRRLLEAGDRTNLRLILDGEKSSNGLTVKCYNRSIRKVLRTTARNR
jgi:hypothetical protein